MLPPTAENAAVYQNVAADIVTATLQGYNGTVFAYGQTAAGKTFTMQGTDATPGVIRHAVNDIMAAAASQQYGAVTVRALYLEIYNEEVRDLLTEGTPTIKVRINPKTGPYPAGAAKVLLSSADEALALLARGESRRVVGGTDMNARSSRSHTIFTLEVETRRAGAGSGAMLLGRLNLVDLAGSESVRYTGAVGQRLKEAANINKSLLTLSRIINLKAKSAPDAFLPYRESKLTHLLEPSLGGNCRTAVICCISPAAKFIEETRSTLSFASSAKAVRTRVSAVEVVDSETRIARLQRELAQVKALLAGTMAGDAQAVAEATHLCGTAQGLSAAEAEAMMQEARAKAAAVAGAKRPRHDSVELGAEEDDVTQGASASLKKSCDRRDSGASMSSDATVADTQSPAVLNKTVRMLRNTLAEQTAAARAAEQELARVSAALADAVAHTAATAEPQEQQASPVTPGKQGPSGELAKARAEAEAARAECENALGLAEEIQDSYDAQEQQLEAAKARVAQLESAAQATMQQLGHVVPGTPITALRSAAQAAAHSAQARRSAAERASMAYEDAVAERDAAVARVATLKAQVDEAMQLYTEQVESAATMEADHAAALQASAVLQQEQHDQLAQQLAEAQDVVAAKEADVADLEELLTSQAEAAATALQEAQTAGQARASALELTVADAHAVADDLRTVLARRDAQLAELQTQCEVATSKAAHAADALQTMRTQAVHADAAARAAQAEVASLADAHDRLAARLREQNEVLAKAQAAAQTAETQQAQHAAQVQALEAQLEAAADADGDAVAALHAQLGAAQASADAAQAAAVQAQAKHCAAEASWSAVHATTQMALAAAKQRAEAAEHTAQQATEAQQSVQARVQALTDALAEAQQGAHDTQVSLAAAVRSSEEELQSAVARMMELQSALHEAQEAAVAQQAAHERELQGAKEVAASKLTAAQARVLELTQQCAAAETALAAAHEHADELDARADHSEDAVQELHRELQQAQAALQQLQEAYDDMVPQLEAANSSTERLQQRAELLQRERDEVESQRQELAQEVQSYHARLQRADAAAKELQQELAGVQAALDTAVEQMDAADARVEQLERAVVDANESCDAAQRREAELSSQLQAQASELQAARHSASALQTAVDAAQAQASEAAAAAAQASARAEAAEDQAASHEHSAKAAQADAQQAAATLQRLQADLDGQMTVTRRLQDQFDSTLAELRTAKGTAKASEEECASLRARVAKLEAVKLTRTQLERMARIKSERDELREKSKAWETERDQLRALLASAQESGAAPGAGGSAATLAAAALFGGVDASGAQVEKLQAGYEQKLAEMTSKLNKYKLEVKRLRASAGSTSSPSRAAAAAAAVTPAAPAMPAKLLTFMANLRNVVNGTAHELQLAKSSATLASKLSALCQVQDQQLCQDAGFAQAHSALVSLLEVLKVSHADRSQAVQASIQTLEAKLAESESSLQQAKTARLNAEAEAARHREAAESAAARADRLTQENAELFAKNRRLQNANAPDMLSAERSFVEPSMAAMRTPSHKQPASQRMPLSAMTENRSVHLTPSAKLGMSQSNPFAQPMGGMDTTPRASRPVAAAAAPIAQPMLSLGAVDGESTCPQQ